MNLLSPRGDDRRASMARRRARRSSIVSVEDLEGRQLMTAGPVGINLDSIVGYVNLMNESNDFYAINNVPLTENAQGWPTSDAQVVVFDERVNEPWNGPDPNAVAPDIGGTYHISFHGEATITPGYLRNFTVQDQAYSAATNTTNADIVVPHNATPFMQICFTNTVDPASSTGAGVSNVVLLAPGYAAGTTQVFTSTYLNALAPFGTLRYLNVDNANSYGTANNSQPAPLDWSERTLPDARSQTSASNAEPGQAWEYMIALANASDTDMWINIPGPATDDYVTQLAGLIKNGDTVGGVYYPGLNPNLKVYVEYSNEVWGGIPSNTSYNNTAAQQEVAAGGSTLNNDGDTNTSDWAGRRYLERTMQITNIFRGVMGADPTFSRIRPVLGWQEQNTSYYTQTFPWFEATYGAPSAYFYGMGNANYWNVTDYSSVNAAIASLQAGEAQTYATTVEFTAIAHFYGLQDVAYEGGPSIDATDNYSDEQVALATARDPRMEALVEQHYLDWFAAGGGVAAYFDGPFGTFTAGQSYDIAELYQESNPSLSPKYRGIADVADAPAPAVTAGFAVSATNITGLPVGSDSVQQNFSQPITGQNNLWLLNVAAAGTYNIALTDAATASGQTGTQPGTVEVLSGDQTVVGTYGVGGNGTFSLGSIALHAGLNTLDIRAIHGFEDPAAYFSYAFQPTALTLTPSPGPTLTNAASFVGSDSKTHGSWMGAYGSAGYDIIGGASSLPSYAAVAPSGQQTYTWAASTADARAPQSSPGSGSRVASAWYSSTSFTVALGLGDGLSHQVSAYLLDWDNAARSERVDVLNAATGAVLSTQTASTFTAGEYLTWNISGNVVLRFTDLAGTSAVLSGLFIGGATAKPASASFAGTDSTTQGNWSGTYGSAGYDVLGGASSLPSYASISPYGQQSYTWAAFSPLVSVPQVAPNSPSRVAGTWYGATSFSVALSLGDGLSHQVSAYLLDWGNDGRSERVDVLGAATGAVLDSETASSFSGGEYLTWDVTGNVVLRFTDLAGPNAVLSALYIGAATTTTPSLASYVGSDTTTQGAWSPTYGSAGYDVLGGASSLPSFATITPSGQQAYTWAASTTQAAALQSAPGSASRVAACWYGQSFNVNADLTDGQAHDVSLYVLDDYNQGRSERVDVLDAATGAVLSTRTVSSFSGGEYLTWDVTGDVTFRVTDLAGPNAVLSGIFFGTAGDVNSASFAGTDSKTLGAWSPTYGSTGYTVANGATSLPTYGTITFSGEQSYTWAASTNQASALQTSPGSSNRTAACWYGSSFNLNVDLTDGQAHNISLYVLDDYNQGRSERVDVIDPTTGAVLSTRTVSSFSGGEYLTWTITGNVQIRITSLAGPNAVLSGVFFK